MNKKNTIYTILILIIILFIIYKCDENTAITLAGLTSLVGIFFTFYSKQSEVNLKEKELNQKLTGDKQKEFYGKKLSAYHKLYQHIINIKQQESSIGTGGGMPDYVVYTSDIKKLLNCIEKNIFFISDEIDTKFQILDKKYKDCFIECEEAMIDKSFTTKTEEDDSYFKSCDCFYTKNIQDIDALSELIIKEVKSIKSDINYKFINN